MTTIEEPFFTLSPHGEQSQEDALKTQETLLGHLKADAAVVGRVALSLAYELEDASHRPADTSGTADIRQTLTEAMIVSGNGQGIDYNDSIWDAITGDQSWRDARRRLDHNYESSETIEKNRKIVALHGFAVFANEYARRQG